MSQTLLVLAAFIIALGIGIFIGKILFSAKSQSEKSGLEERINGLLGQIEQLKIQFQTERNQFEKSFAQLSSEKENLQKEKESLAIHLAKKENDFDNLLERNKEQKQEVEQLQEKFTKEFENLANKILEEKTEKFTLLNQNNLKNILEPFQEKIQELRNKVSETYDKESKERFSLGEKVKELAELNQQISEDAKKLTRALKGESKTQGNWGEMILESILEKSGLAKGREYFLEHELKDDDNKALVSFPLY